MATLRSPDKRLSLARLAEVSDRLLVIGFRLDTKQAPPPPKQKKV